MEYKLFTYAEIEEVEEQADLAADSNCVLEELDNPDVEYHVKDVHEHDDNSLPDNGDDWFSSLIVGLYW